MLLLLRYRAAAPAPPPAASAYAQAGVAFPPTAAVVDLDADERAALLALLLT